MKKILLIIIVLLSVLSACVTQGTRRSEAREQELQGDPVLVAKVRKLLEQGNLALVRKDFRGAEARALESIQVLPTFEGYYLLGMIYRDQQKSDQALQALLKAEELRPDQEQLLLTLGLIYGARGDTDLSLQRFNRLLALDPEDPVYNYRTGVLYKEKKEYEKSLDLLKKADRDGFQHRDQVLLQLGDVCLELRRFDEADEYFQKAQKANPKLQDALKGTDASQTARLLEQGNQYFRQKDYARAEGAYREAMQLSPRSPAPRLQLGSIFLARGDVAGARNQFEEALRLSPESREARILVASTARRQADYDRSLKVIEEGLRGNSDDPELQNQLGLHHAAQGERERAALIFEKLLSRNERYTPARKNLLFQYIELGRFADARRHLAVVQKQEPGPQWKETADRIQIHEILEKGHTLFRKRQYRRAEGEYNRALRLKKDYVPTQIALGRVRILNGNLRGAESAFRTVRATEPENPEALEGLLTVYERTGNGRAKAALQREIRVLGASKPEVLLAFALMKEQEGQKDEAFQEYRALLARLPGNAYIKRRMAGIQIQYAIDKNARNRFDEAAVHINEATRLDPSHPALERNKQIVEENRKYRNLIPEIERAELAFRRGDYGRAEQQFSRLYRQWPRPSFLVRLAEIRFETGRDAAGQAMLVEALKKDPAGLEFREALYSRLLDRRQLDEAEEGFKKIISEDESAFFSSYKLGVIDMLRERYDSALEYMQQSLLYKPDFLPARIARGVVYYERGKKEEARREFEEARKIELHGQELALLNLALMEWNDGSQRTEKALTELTKLYPDFADPYYHLAYLNYSKGNQRGALQHIDRALTLQTSPEFLFARIEILEKMKSARELDTTGRQFLRDYPGDERANRVRRMLARSGGQKDYVEPAMRFPAGTNPVYAFPGSFLIVRPDMVLGIERGTDRVLFQTEVAALDHHLEGFLMVLEKGRVRSFDPETGEELLPLAVPATACGISGTAARPILQLQCSKQKPTVFRMGRESEGKELSAAANSRLMTLGEDRYLLRESAELTLLDGSLNEVRKFKPGEAIRELIRTEDGSGLILLTSAKLVFLNSDLNEISTVVLQGRQVVLRSSPLIVSGATVQILSSKGENGSTFRLPSTPLSQDTLSIVSPEKISYVDRNRQLVLVDRTGKIVLREDLKKTGASVFRLYPVTATE